MKPGKPEPIEATERYQYFSAQYAIRDLYDALVELITNADDSYGRMREKNGSLLIEVERRHQGGKVIIRDRAEGLSLDEMRRKFKKSGTKTSHSGDRGFMARGVKDCRILGNLSFESIKDGYLHKCDLLSSFEGLVPYEPSRKVADADRKRLSIPHGNGTMVIFELKENVKVARHENMKDLLPWHFALRDIFNPDSSVRVLLRDLNKKGSKPEPVTYNQPAGEKVVSEEFEVPNYHGVKARIIIFKAAEAFEDGYDKRFRKSGILVKGERAIHEITLFSKDLDQDPYATRYYGKLTCDYIDQLCDEYDKRRAMGESHPESNPNLVIDPNRQTGLRKDHPFTKALYEIPAKYLKDLVERDKELDRKQHARVANEQTEKQLKLLAQAASRFLREQLEEFEESSTEKDVDTDAFTKKGILLIPTFCVVCEGEERSLTLRARKIEGISLNEVAHVSSDNACIQVLTPDFCLTVSRTDDQILTGNFKIKGLRAGCMARIAVKYDGLPEAEAIISVVDKKEIENIELSNPLCFEKNDYKVREGKKKTLILRAKFPDVVSSELFPDVISDNRDVPIIGAKCKLIPVAGSNYAEGKVIIQGRRLYAKAVISAKVEKFTATAQISVVQDDEPSGPPIKFDIRDEHFGNLRAKWDRPNNPNVLLIAAQHESIARYLGAREDKFPGQDSPLFKILLAEIVSESVCRKILEAQAQLVPWEFENMDIDTFYAKHNKLMREFTPVAHRIQLSDRDLATFKDAEKKITEKEIHSQE